MHAELIKLDLYTDLESDWRRLEQKCDCPPFLSWAWAGTWLRGIPHDLGVEVFRATDGHGKVVALGLIVDAPERGLKRLFGSRALRLQEAGCNDIDSITVEYSGLLSRHDQRIEAYSAFFDLLSRRRRNWRAFELSASLHANAIRNALPDGLQAFSLRESTAHFIDLHELRSKDQDYLSCLPRKTRQTLRKAKAQYEKEGELSVEVATTPETAHVYLGEMRKLHDRYWHAKGESSAFDNPFFCRFHQDLVRQHTASGFVQLIKLSAGPVLIGYEYHLLWKNGAYSYNSGFNYGALGQSDMPGHLASLLMAEKYKSDGIDFYDFLSGDSGYKRRICTHSRAVHWIQIRRHGLRSACELMLLKYLKRRDHAPLPESTGIARIRGDRI